MQIRRIVTGRDSEGSSVFVLGERAPMVIEFVQVPGMSVSQIWSTSPEPSLSLELTDPVLNQRSVLPKPGGTQFMFVTFPPDAVTLAPEFDASASAAESLRHLPGLAECFEQADPGMHTTDTVDYGIVLEGEIWLELDGGRTQHLQRHDVVVQNGTRHAWRNKSQRPTLMAFVLVGARRE